MNQFKHIMLAVLLMVLTTLPTAAQQSEYFLHTVTKGQGLYSISRMYGVTEDDIIKLNPGSEKVIKVGQELRIPNRTQPSSGHFHTIQKGETLYRLSVENRVSVKEICDANPGLSADNFKIGQVITIPAPSDEDPFTSTVELITGNNRVPESTRRDIETLSAELPQFKTTHTVQRRETIYKLSRMYGISEEDFLDANPEYRDKKLRKGAVVNIPYSREELAQFESKRNEARNRIESIPDQTLFMMNQPTTQDEDDGILTAALILPFSLDDTTSTEQRKMVEFYQGMLLALDKLKNENISANLKVFDSKNENKSIKSLLESGKLDDVDIIFGPKWPNHITEAAQWSTKHKIPLVLPMNANADDVFNNPYIFQLNTPKSYFNEEVYNHFLKQFRKPNVIFLNAANKDSDFIEGLKATLNEHGISHSSVSTANTEQIEKKLVRGKQNIFIINTSDVGPLNSILPLLQLITRNKDPEIETHLFGYPEYQVYASDHLDELFEVDTWFYSWFYTNNMLQESLEFNTSFRRAFSRQMMLSFPSYASYGYDTGYYFLKGIARYGKDMDNNLDKIRTKPVQMGFKFERVNNWGGFINRKVFFIHLSNDFRVEKIDFDK